MNPAGSTDKVTWSSSDESVVSVEANSSYATGDVAYVSPQGPGTAVITAKAGKKTVTCTFTYKGSAEIGYASFDKSSLIYNGKKQKPKLSVYSSNGTKLSSASYTVSGLTAQKDVGTYKVTVKGKGSYSGTATATFSIVPKTPKVTVKAGKKSFTVKASKQSQTNGFVVSYVTGKKAKTVTCKGASLNKTIKKLKKGKKYQVAVAAYKTVKGKKVYSAFSKAKTVKVK